MHQKGLTGLDAERSQLCGDVVPGDKRAGRRGCGHGPGVSRTGARGATELPLPVSGAIDRMIVSAGQIRYA
ncbi:hypothetical protein GCM10010345_15340 [Streptomyces canarius]|uniref:Uncharacterized protein n=1 Tax=Streptomyces canarius TaxID=285453 RepID=A0ABQ3CGD7_9ACTN|nr:hypothetical protein GCM10010345_15340 [Streptomyces canarius]